MRFLKLIHIFCLMFGLCLSTSCAFTGQQSASSFPPGKSLSQLERAGWEIGDPTTVLALEQSPSLKQAYSDSDWDEFKILFKPGDELRQVSYSAAHGVAIFRDGLYVASFLPIIVTQ